MTCEQRKKEDKEFGKFYDMSGEATKGTESVPSTSAMWVSMGRKEPSTCAPLNSLAGQCEMNLYLKDTGEYFRTRHLIIEHLWNLAGEGYD